jgi:hypothetical protein
MTKLVEFGGMTCLTLHTSINILLINLNICCLISIQNFHNISSLKESTTNFPTPIEADLHFVNTSPPKKMPSLSTDHKFLTFTIISLATFYVVYKRLLSSSLTLIVFLTLLLLIRIGSPSVSRVLGSRC